MNIEQKLGRELYLEHHGCEADVWEPCENKEHWYQKARDLMARLGAANLDVCEGWQDIESAPKDGTEIDILLNGRGRVTDVKWGWTDCFTNDWETWLDWKSQPVLMPGDPINEITHYIRITPAPTD